MNKIKTRSFDRSLRPSLLSQLIESSGSGWWNDVLNDDQLVIALRGSFVNVYWKGQSIFKIEAAAKGLKATTHEKFLLDPKLGGQISFDGQSFDVGRLEAKAFLRSYLGAASLERMKSAAGVYSGEEKAGCHWIAVANPRVIDVEIALPGTVEREDPGDVVTSPRIDLLALEPFGVDAARLVFWEAKAFKNTELGSPRSTLVTPVLAQIAAYRAILERHRADLETSYAKLCLDLLRIRTAADQTVEPLIVDVATGRRRLTLGDVPQVNLLVFGFDGSQKNDPSWKLQSSSLASALEVHGARLRAVGDPKGKRL